MYYLFKDQYRSLRSQLLEAPDVDVGTWHAMNVAGNPLLVTQEIHAFFRSHIPRSRDEAQRVFQPNLPWAEAQFLERVSGFPSNPGKTYVDWPWQSQMSDHTTSCTCGHPKNSHLPDGRCAVDFGRGRSCRCEAFKAVEPTFSHTYMERYWPKHAHRAGYRGPGDEHLTPHRGIRYAYGDLADVTELLARSPHTRQAYLPVWFPEDTGGVHGGRLPCSLGYHFLLRDSHLHVSYFIRSCDFVRHFRDDVYLTARLVQWVLGELCSREDEGTFLWHEVKPGLLTFHCPSLHIMKGDVPKLKAEVDRERRTRATSLPAESER